MGYDTEVTLVYGILIEDLDQFETICNKLDLEYDDDYSVGESIPETHYTIRSFSICGDHSKCAIILKSYNIQVLRSTDPPVKVETPTEAEIKEFIKWIDDKCPDMGLKYEQFMIVSGG